MLRQDGPDRLNAGIEASRLPGSVIGQEAMGLESATLLLPRLDVGAGKPWQRSHPPGAQPGTTSFVGLKDPCGWGWGGPTDSPVAGSISACVLANTLE